MTQPNKHEIIALALALEEVPDLGPHGLRFLCREAASLIRRLRPDLNFVETDVSNVQEGK